LAAFRQRKGADGVIGLVTFTPIWKLVAEELRTALVTQLSLTGTVSIWILVTFRRAAINRQIEPWQLVQWDMRDLSNLGFGISFWTIVDHADELTVSEKAEKF
jgi:hypothetical protein